MSFTIRPYTEPDATASLNLYLDTIRQINSRDYSETQIDAWASDEITTADWHQRFQGRFAIVAIESERLVGFADLTNEDYLDRLFVSAQHQRRGIAHALLQELLEHAQYQEISRVFADVSITAKPFFSASGFHVIQEQTVQSRGVTFINYRMERPANV